MIVIDQNEGVKYSNEGGSIRQYTTPTSDNNKPISSQLIDEKISKLNLGSFSEEIKEEESSRNESSSESPISPKV